MEEEEGNGPALYRGDVVVVKVQDTLHTYNDAVHFLDQCVTLGLVKCHQYKEAVLINAATVIITVIITVISQALGGPCG